MPDLQKPVQNIKGIGPKTSILLNKINIYTMEDLLTHFPRQYEDRSIIKPLNKLLDGETASVIGEVALIDKDRYTSSGKHITRIILKSDAGYVVGVWFNQKFMRRNFKIGEKYLFYGKVSVLYGETQIMSPEYEMVQDEGIKGILPIYPSTKDLSQKTIRNGLHRLMNSENFVVEETLPEEIIKKYNLCTLRWALKSIHFPDKDPDIKESQNRIIFEELLILQLGLMMEKYSASKDINGISFEVKKEFSDFTNSLPFKFTKSQEKVVMEIINDMKSNKQMNRLLQGDVGSGKTVIAAAALFNAVKNGYQGIMMAPTEILSCQHYETLSSLFREFDINIQLLSGKTPKKQKDIIKEMIKTGKVDIIIGTHALIQEDVEFKNPGLVITDEQHRFGVRQRANLSQKGKNPDVLVMTATPIPRTMALFIYGDLDISIIDELPPGRQKINTYAVKPEMRQRVYNFILKEVKNGRQAYVVCPLIDESEGLDAESAVAMAGKLKEEYLKDINVGLLHGKMKPSEKDSVMMDFRDRKIDVLVSTTVIEVGINIQNAVIMVVENAERFGLSTLHQLRGRVGRGEHKSYCILISEMKSEVSRKRMKIMERLDDGFKIAEEDLKLRGTGEFFGTRQHGLPELKMADLFRDIGILKITNSLAKELVQSNKIFSQEYNKLREKVEEKFAKTQESITFN